MAVSVIICNFAEMKRKGSIYCLLCLCALWLMVSCTGNGAQMRQQLEALEQQNRSGEQMLNDSLAESLVSYFDKHGDANERMRAKYILGRTYYCLGELPRALETYYEAADCADTTAADCDFAKLSRIHAQSADVFHKQVQPRSELNELRFAEYYAKRGKDTLMAIECYALQARAYKYLEQHDSVIDVTEKASFLFTKIGRKDRSVQVLGHELSSLIKKGYLSKAKENIEKYERFSGYVNDKGSVIPGFKIFYYVKGEYFLAINKIDSAEFLFRKELRDGKDLNNQIAGCKGLQKVFERKAISDSIAKYANLGYILNDSAYSLSEMQNIQKLQASYNYNHQQFLAKQSRRDSERDRIIFMCFAAIILIVGGVAFAFYRSKKLKKLAEYRQNLEALGAIQSELQVLCGEDGDILALIAKKNEEISDLQYRISEYQKQKSDKERANLEDILSHAPITQHLYDLLKENPVQRASRNDVRQIANLINEQIPCFYRSLNASQILRPVEYEVCMLIRCHFKPSSIGKLLGLDEAYVSNIRRRILHKVYGIEGNPKDLDERILAIV